MSLKQLEKIRGSSGSAEVLLPEANENTNERDGTKAETQKLLEGLSNLHGVTEAAYHSGANPVKLVDMEETDMHEYHMRFNNLFFLAVNGPAL